MPQKTTENKRKCVLNRLIFRIRKRVTVLGTTYQDGGLKNLTVTSNIVDKTIIGQYRLTHLMCFVNGWWNGDKERW